MKIPNPLEKKSAPVVDEAEGIGEAELEAREARVDQADIGERREEIIDSMQALFGKLISPKEQKIIEKYVSFRDVNLTGIEKAETITVIMFVNQIVLLDSIGWEQTAMEYGALLSSFLAANGAVGSRTFNALTTVKSEINRTITRKM